MLEGDGAGCLPLFVKEGLVVLFKAHALSTSMLVSVCRRFCGSHKWDLLGLKTVEVPLSRMLPRDTFDRSVYGPADLELSNARVGCAWLRRNVQLPTGNWDDSQEKLRQERHPHVLRGACPALVLDDD